MRWPNTECQVFEFRSKLFNKPHFMYLQIKARHENLSICLSSINKEN